MRKGSDLIGKLVVSFETGEALARVGDLIFDQDNNTLAGFLVDEGSWLGGAWVIPYSEVLAMGADAVLIPTHNAIVKARKHGEIRQILKRQVILKGTRIMTTQGANLGTMVDLYLNEKTGAVTGYEVSGGLFADVYSGRSFVPAPQTLKIGADYAFVPPEIADLMAEQVGGIKQTVLTTRDRLQTGTGLVARQLQTASQSIVEKLQETTSYTNQRLQEVINQAVTTVMSSIADPAEQQAFVLGRTVDRDIVLPNGTTLIRAQQPVTEAIAQAAAEASMLDQLYRAVGGSFAEELSRRVQETTAVTNQRLQEVVNQATAAMLNSIADPAEQKAFMIGKQVDQSVVAPDGLVIIAQGEYVTAAIADLAEQKAMLNPLYRAVGGSFAADLNQKVQDATNATQQRLQEVIHQAVGPMLNSIVDPAEQKAFMVGKTADQNVVAPDGTVLIAQGETVTLFKAELAEQQAMLDQLYRAVGSNFAAELSRRIQETTLSTNQRLQEVVNQAVTAMTSSIIDPTEQKAFMLGKTVDQDLLTPEGTLLIAQGSPVTAHIAEVAEEQAMLDQLYKAVGGSFAAELSQKASGILARRMVDQTLGRRVKREVRTADDVIVAATGQIVTEAVVEQARMSGKEQALLEATGVSLQTVMHDQGQALSTAGDRALKGAAQVGDRASSLWELVQTKTHELQAKGFQAIEDRRIHHALGRPVTRVILDRQDNVILNVGELITHEAIRRSRQDGLLDILLSSVLIKVPELSSAALKAPIPSLASLQQQAPALVP